jgi:hypothetical protein
LFSKPYLLSDKEPHEEMLAIDSLTTINVSTASPRARASGEAELSILTFPLRFRLLCA